MSDRDSFQFGELCDHLASESIVHLNPHVTTRSPQAETQRPLDERIRAALDHPAGFPAIRDAIVPGDQVALAVDANVPRIASVLASIVDYVREQEPSSIDVVLTDEVCDSVLDSIRESLGMMQPPTVDVAIHKSDLREDLRFLGADEDAEPVYVDRRIVDADFVLPVLVDSVTRSVPSDRFGVLPEFTDSLSRLRFEKSLKRRQYPGFGEAIERTLGVQAVFCVLVNADGAIDRFVAGDPHAIASQDAASLTDCQTTGHGLAKDERGIEGQAQDEPPNAKLVVATLDGDVQQQSWLNAARAAIAASQYLTQGGTIVIWSRIKETPRGQLTRLSSMIEDWDADDDAESADDIESLHDADHATDEDVFPNWDSHRQAAKILAAIASEYRLLIHCDLDHETIESMGLGVIGSHEDLNRITRSYEACGFLRAASFQFPQASTFVSPTHG